MVTNILRIVWVVLIPWTTMSKSVQPPIDISQAMAMQAKGRNIRRNMVRFDTDSTNVGMDNRCTACISHSIDDFDGPLVATGRTVQCIGGIRIPNLMKGTLVWIWEDDEGTLHISGIKNSFYFK